MKKLLIVLGGIFAALLLTLGIAAAILVPRGLRLNAAAVAFLDQVVPAIADDWDYRILKKHATAELTEANSDDDLERQCARWQRQLGALVSHQPAQGMINTSATAVNWSGNSRTTGRFQLNAVFENGPAIVQVDLLRSDDQWRISGLEINQPPAAPNEAP